MISCSRPGGLRRFAAFLRLFSLGTGSLLLALAAATAQSAQTGTVTGRISNPNTGEYVRNAQVRVAGSSQSALSEDGGLYRLSNLPAGDVTLVVTYTGSETTRTTVRIEPGVVVTRDFELASALGGAADAAGAPITLSAFTVSSEREGNAKAIMNQRNSMNITNSVPSDVFGDVAEGNVGEFLKHMPGIMLNLVEGEARTVSLRGLGPEYTAVTLDGISLASADANSSAAGDARVQLRTGFP